MKRIALIALCATLGACSGGDHEDLKRWMAESTKDMRGKIPPLPEVKPYQPVPYDVEGIVDPFRPSKIEPESRVKGGGKGGPSSRTSMRASCATACSKNIRSNR